MKKLILFFIVLVLGFNSEGQSLKLKRANQKFEHLAYASAIGLYNDMLGSKNESPVMLFNLAMCYYNTNRMQEAVGIFSKYLNSTQGTADELFYYAQALKQVGKTIEGDEQLKKLFSLSSSDLRAKSLIENQNYLDEIKSRGDQYTVKNLKVNSEGSDFGGYPYFDEVLFLSTRYESLSIKREWTWDGTRFLDVFTANENNGELSETGMLRPICSKYHEGPLCFDGGTGIYFTRNNAGKTKFDQNGIRNLSLFFGSVDKLGGISESLMPFCSAEYSVGHPALSPDKKTLYFASDMPGSKGVDIYEVEVLGYGKWGTPKKVEGNVNTDGDEMFPFVSADGILYFSSNGHIGLGGLDVFRRKSNGEVQNLGQSLNSLNDDFAFVLKSDKRSGYVSSNRVGGKGGDDIYSFTYTGPFEIAIEGIVKDEKSGEKISNAYIVIKDAKGKQITSVMTDKDGNYSIPALSGTAYTIEVKKEGFSSQSADVVTTDEILKKDFNLKKAGVEFVYEVKDKLEKTPVEGVSINVKDNRFNTTFDLATAESGFVSRGEPSYKIGDAVDLQISLSKDGYLNKTVQLKTTVNSNVVNVSELLDLALSKLAVGGDLNDLIEINPIYFDLGKFSIRKDAAVELDKIVSIMNQYPKMKIELGSHTDCRSSVASNQKLSDRRAKASADYIKKKITDPNRINGVGYGESKLKVNCPCEGNVKSDCSEEEHQKNRRTEFIIISVK
jgi:outer membrane protein OmpA-like peptidoglycan-associated protein